MAAPQSVRAILIMLPRKMLGRSVLLFLTITSSSEAAIIATKKMSTPHAGVTVIEGTTRAPSSKFYAAKVALCTPGVRVDATEPPSSLRTVPSWAQSVGASVAVNGDFFRTGPAIAGIAVGGGKPWPFEQLGVDPSLSNRYFFERYGWIAFGPDFVEFTHTKHVKENAALFKAQEGYSPSKVVHTFPKGTVALVSGFPEVVTEGKRYTCASPTAAECFPDRGDMRERHPRSAMGLTEDRRTFILAVVDGRSTTSAGMYGTELAELMSELGAWQAFNLDGGGSSEMWIRGRGTVNDPSDGSSRPVGNHWGIFNGKGAAAHCVDLAEPADAGAPPPAGSGEPETGDAGIVGSTDDKSDGDASAATASTQDHADEGSEGCMQTSHSRRGSFSAALLVIFALLFAVRERRRRLTLR